LKFWNNFQQYFLFTIWPGEKWRFRIFRLQKQRSNKDDEAISEFAASKDIFASLVHSYPSDLELTIDLADSMFREASFYRLTGNLTLAMDDCLSGSRILLVTKIADDQVVTEVKPITDGPGAPAIRSHSIKVSAFGVIEMAETLLALGQHDEATKFTNDIILFIDAVLETDSQDFYAEELYIQALLFKGRVLMASGQWDMAIKLLAEALDDCRRIASTDDSNLEPQALEAIAEGELAIATQASGAPSDSLQYSREFYPLAVLPGRLIPQGPGLRWVVTRAGAWGKNIT